MTTRLARVAAGLLLALAVGAGSSGRSWVTEADASPPAPASAQDVAARVRQALEKDAEDLRRLAKWGDENGVPRQADADWERSLSLDPSDASGETRKRLRFVKRDGAWARDGASWALLLATPDAKPDRTLEYEAKRSDSRRASAARHRTLAATLRGLGADAAADAEIAVTLARDPDDVWSHLALGEVLDHLDGWVPAELQRRRIAAGRAESYARRLRALGVEAVHEVGEGSRSAAAGVPLATWRLREWRLETDLDDEAAAGALAAVELGARWFRDRFGVDASAPVLPGEGRFIVLSTPERYAQVVDREPSLSDAEKKFAKSLSAVPLNYAADKGPWAVVIERPDAEFAADACLHYALHLLFQARFRVEAQEGWLYEGLVAYATLRLIGLQASWCVRMEETSAEAGPRGGSPETFAEQAYELVATRRDEPLTRLVGASLNELDGPMLLKSWSILRMLLEEHPEEANAFLAAKRSGSSTAQAFELSTGLRVEDVDAAWRIHVLATEGE